MARRSMIRRRRDGTYALDLPDPAVATLEHMCDELVRHAKGLTVWVVE